MLRALGVRLALLGACETARRDKVNVWNGVAPALMNVGIAAGLSLDEAMSAGRVGILYEAPDDGIDWGVPVLYMRAGDGVVFHEITTDPTLAPVRDQIRLDIQQRVEMVRGKLIGVQAWAIKSGAINVHQEITQVGAGGAASGVEAKTIGGV